MCFLVGEPQGWGHLPEGTDASLSPYPLEESTEVSLGRDICHAELGSPSSFTGPLWSVPLPASFLLQPWWGQSKWGRESE